MSLLNVNKVDPATGTGLELGSSGDTITIPSGATFNTSSATLTLPSTVISGQTAITSLADTDKFLVSDASDSGNLKYVENQYLGGGVWELLQSIDASSTATVDFTYDFPTDYNNYVIYFNDLGLASNGYLAFRAQVGGNSGVRDGGNDYGNARYGRRTNGDNASQDLATGDANYSMININSGQGVFSGDWNAQGYVWIMNPNDDHYKYFQFNANYGTSGNNINNVQGGGVMYQNGDLSRVQFMNEDGHNMSGTFRLYGLKNA